MTRFFGWMALALLAITVRAANVEHLTSPQSRSLKLPFSEAVRVDDTIYLSGQIGNVPGEKKLVEGGIVPKRDRRSSTSRLHSNDTDRAWNRLLNVRYSWPILRNGRR